MKCNNVPCQKTFYRILSHISPSSYCSRSCAAKANNANFPKKHAVIKKCLECSKNFKSNEKYCSKLCTSKAQTITPDQIIKDIQLFYKKFNRIPLKREFPQARAARLRFLTWNNAIILAGFSPNPVRFSRKFIAKDGHQCDSLSEKIIDDWFLKNKIRHEKNVSYQFNNLTADFKINTTYIEYLGLKGEFKPYDTLLLKKRKLWKEKGISIIELYPQDLFPINNLYQKIKNIV